MKKFMVIAAMAAVVLASCNKNGIETDDKKDVDNTVSGIVFNEIDGQNKFIELYNTSDKEQSLEGITVVKYDSAKDGGKSTTWTGAAGLKLAAHSWMYIESSDLADPNEKGDPDYQYQSENHIFKGGLSGKKNLKLELVSPKGDVLDSFVRGNEGAGWNQVGNFENNKTNSFSRVPDGTGAWKYAAPTKGAANGEATGEIEQEPNM